MTPDPVLEKLQSFKKLNHNWDLHGGRSISPEAIRLATQVYEEILRQLDPLEWPRIQKYLFPMPHHYGGVGLYWNHLGFVFEVDIEVEGDLGFLYVRDPETQQERWMQRELATPPETVREFVRAFKAHAFPFRT